MCSINTEVIPTSFFLAQELIPGYLNGIEGTYQTPKGYYVAFENKDAFEAYETTFPQKEKIIMCIIRSCGHLPSPCS